MIYQYIKEEVARGGRNPETVREEVLCPLHFREVYPDGIMPHGWKNGEKVTVTSIITLNMHRCTFCDLAPEFQPEHLTPTTEAQA